MIAFDRKTNCFFLHGKSFSCVLWIDPNGYLTDLHFGGRVGEDDLRAFDMRTRPVSFAPTPPDSDHWFSLDIAAQEYGSYGQGDFRAPSVIIERQDGSRASRFHYAGHRIYAGVPALGGFPCARKGKETL